MHSQIRGLTDLVGIKFTRTTKFSLLLAGLFLSTSAIASPASDEAAWFVSFLKANNGQAFCLPPTMTVQDAANLLSRYSRAHPELHDQINDRQAIQAFADTYPCVAVHPTSSTFTASPGGGQMQIQVRPQGEYAAIDTKLAIETIRKLQGTAGSESDVLISDVENNSGNYAPPVLFALASLLYKQGRSDDAVFWFNAARLRANFDAARCADLSARSAVPALVAQIPVQLRRSQFDDAAKLKDIINRVVQWDESTPYNYDYRWINLHGLDAMRSGLGNADTTNKPLSLPREEWGGLAQKTRADYVGSLDAAIEAYEKQKATN
jgi:Rap1a immunity proteins